MDYGKKYSADRLQKKKPLGKRNLFSPFLKSQYFILQMMQLSCAFISQRVYISALSIGDRCCQFCLLFAILCFCLITLEVPLSTLFHYTLSFTFTSLSPVLLVRASHLPVSLRNHQYRQALLVVNVLQESVARYCCLFPIQIHNDDGVWLRLNDETIKKYVPNMNGYNEAWCLSFNQHLGKSLLAPVDVSKNK